MKYVIVAINRDGKEFMRTKRQDIETLPITAAMREFVKREVWYVGDIIKVEEAKDG